MTQEFRTKIVGTSFRGKETRTLLKSLPTGTALSLEREYDNPYDELAIKVNYILRTNNNSTEIHLGYIPRTDNARLAKSYDLYGWPKNLKVLLDAPYNGLIIYWEDSEWLLDPQA